MFKNLLTFLSNKHFWCVSAVHNVGWMFVLGDWEDVCIRITCALHCGMLVLMALTSELSYLVFMKTASFSPFSLLSKISKKYL